MTTEPDDRALFDPAGAAQPTSPERGEASLFDESYDQPTVTGAVRAYVISATQRSGSTVLCHLLTATGAMGVPTEYFGAGAETSAIGRRLDAVGTDGRLRLGRYLAALIRRRSTPNGVFGVKMHFHQLETRSNRRPLQKLLVDARYVWLRRRDPIAQAISFALAQRTGRFQESRDVARPSNDPPFELREVLNAWRGLALQDAGWQVYFQANGIAPLEVWYEDMLADPDWTCRRIGQFLGVTIERPVSLDAVPIRRQRSTVSEIWRAALMDHLRIAGSEGTP